MSDEKYVKRYYPDAELDTRQNGVWGEYRVTSFDSPTNWIGDYWYKDPEHAWSDARRKIEAAKRGKS